MANLWTDVPLDDSTAQRNHNGLRGRITSRTKTPTSPLVRRVIKQIKIKKKTKKDEKTG